MEEEVKNRTSQIMRESFQISVISKMEFLGFPFSSEEKQQATQLIAFAQIAPLDDEVVQKVIEIREKNALNYPMPLLQQQLCIPQVY